MFGKQKRGDWEAAYVEFMNRDLELRIREITERREQADHQKEIQRRQGIAEAAMEWVAYNHQVAGEVFASALLRYKELPVTLQGRDEQRRLQLLRAIEAEVDKDNALIETAVRSETASPPQLGHLQYRLLSIVEEHLDNERQKRDVNR